ncbi:glycosyltransferase [Piscibacillus halophilus]|uniref:glycosyltransferase n=1 Tax=Piscibacillus halophilus TaxID=571933 RepID=UPI00158971C5|nr:glycosyltransferase [Piscibacillus halophilus]
MQNIVVLHIAALSFNKASGLTTSVPALLTAQNRQNNVNAGLVISKGEKPENWNTEFPVFQFKKDFFKISLEDLEKPFNQPDLVVFHSTYFPIHAKFAKTLNKKAIPYIIVPRGGMTKNSQNIKPVKKMMGNKLFFNKMVKDALAIHCLTRGECEESRHWGKETFIVGNGMNLPIKYAQKDYKTREQFIFTFIGRLDPYHKGLDILIEGCALAYKDLERENCVIRIYGPDKQGSVKDLNQKIKEYNLERLIRISPPTFDKEKEDVLQNTHVFIHTSRFEGHPMSVLEALSYGIPCLLTPGTNISQEVSKAGAGWEVQLSPESVAEGIKTVLTNKDKIDEMSKNARELVLNDYSWDKVALNTIHYYSKLLKR